MQHEPCELLQCCCKAYCIGFCICLFVLLLWASACRTKLPELASAMLLDHEDVLSCMVPSRSLHYG